MSDIVGSKAISVVVNNEITEHPKARVFEVASRSSDTVYVQVLVPGRNKVLCTCPAGQRGSRCYHAEAAALHMRRERDRN